MKPSAPTKLLWIIAMIVGILGIFGHFVSVEFLTEHSFWMVLIGFVLLAIGTTFKGI